MKSHFLLFFIFLLSLVDGQNYEGSVMDYAGNAIQNAVVYYPKSSTSIKSNELGEFSIQKLLGENILIISHPDFGIETIVLEDFKGKKIEVLMSEKVILSNTIAYSIYKKDCNYFLSLFRNHFLGRTVNRWHSKILNEEVIQFT